VRRWHRRRSPGALEFAELYGKKSLSNDTLSAERFVIQHAVSMNIKQFILSTLFALLMGVCAHVDARVHHVNDGSSKTNETETEDSPFKALGEDVGDYDIDFDAGSSNSTEDRAGALAVAGTVCTFHGGVCYFLNGCTFDCGWKAWFGCKECSRKKQIKKFKCSSATHDYIRKTCSYVSWATFLSAPDKIQNLLGIL
jgi:hypothetical protein